jgi:putative SOS response-associated peptidase YedK
MCGRYTLIKLSDFLEYFPWIEMTNSITAARYNIAPSQEVAAIINAHLPARVDQLRWGLIPSWAKDASITAGSRMINARAETLASKPAFARLLKRRRCLIPANGFYEWRSIPGVKTKVPCYFHLKNNRPFAFAGLWDQWQSPDGSELKTCTIITTSANELLAGMHDRMPVILKDEDCRGWITTDELSPEQAGQFLAPYPANQMAMHPVSTTVNSPHADRPEMIDPAEIPPVESALKKVPTQPLLFPDLA